MRASVPHSQSQAMNIAEDVLIARGYLVVASAGTSGEYTIGQIVYEIWGTPVDQPFCVARETGRADWEAQNDLIGALRPKFRRVTQDQVARFWVFVAD